MLCKLLLLTFLLTCSSLFPSKKVVNKYQPTDFIPPKGVFSFLTSNNHYQTVVGSGALSQKVKPFVRSFEVKKETIHTNDGDIFDVEYTSNFHSSDQIVIILHGLESTSSSPVTTKIASAYLSAGFGCCLVSFRSCNGADNNLVGAYHLGFTQDLDHIVKLINKRYPLKRIYLSGFSLGGNVLLKYLGELGDEASSLNIYGGVAASVPFNPLTSQQKVDAPGFSRLVYSNVSCRVYTYLYYYIHQCTNTQYYAILIIYILNDRISYGL